MLTEGSLTAVAAFELVVTLLCVSLNEGNYRSFTKIGKSYSVNERKGRLYVKDSV